GLTPTLKRCSAFGVFQGTGGRFGSSSAGWPMTGKVRGLAIMRLSRHEREAHPQRMKMGASAGRGAMMSGRDACGARAVVLAGAFKPVIESGPGRCYAPQIVASALRRARRVDCSTPSPLPPPARAPRDARDGYSLPLLLWPGRPQGEGRRLRPQAP